MESDLSVEKPKVKIKKHPEVKKMEETRSFSVGSIKLTKSEINKIVGVKDDVTHLLSDTGKQTGQQQIPGSSKKIDEYSNENDKYNSVFKANPMLIRTPPTNEAEKENKQINRDMEEGKKRQRSETTPEQYKTCKRPCEEVTNNTEEINFEKENSSNMIENRTLSEKMIENFFTTLDVISNAMDKEKDEDGNISLPREDQKAVKQAHTKICKFFTSLVFSTSEIEKENIVLKNKIQQTDRKSETREDHQKIKQYPNNTYANITRNMENTTTQNEYQNSQEEKWTTPKTTKKHETIIRIDNVHDPKETIATLRNIKEIGKGFKNIKQTKNGAVIIESHDKEQQDKLKTVINNIDNIKYKENNTNNPMFMITGIVKGYSDSEFVEELERLNDDIVKELQTTIQDKIKVVAKKECRNPEKENWILQAPAKITKWFLKKGTIYFDLVMLHVQEHVNLAFCFKCSGFDHVAKYCTQRECCHKCGEQHNAKECTATTLRCANCQKMKYTDTQHSARDTNCPVYKRRLARFRNNIDYGEDFL